MNRFAMFFAGLLFVCSMSGCCLHGYGAGYGAGCGSCGPCGAGGAYPSAFAPGPGRTAFAPAPYPNTAMIDPLSTY